MKKIGLTGGIGSGKSTVARIFLALGIPVYFSDDRSKTLLDSHPVLQKELKAAFGKSIYQKDLIDRAAFAALIFSDPIKLEQANAIIHPFVRKDFQIWVAAQATSYVINEAAILFETGRYASLDATILVTAPESLRIKRVAFRDNQTDSAIRNRMQNQWSDSKKTPLADFIIENDEKTGVIRQVLTIDQKIRSKH